LFQEVPGRSGRDIGDPKEASVTAGLVLFLLAAQAEGVDFFEKKVRPLLAERCLKCHGAEKPKGGLRLDRPSNLLRGGRSGPVVIPGDPSRSLLIAAVRRTDPDLKMPPDQPLSPSEVADLVAWVRRGAPAPADSAPAAASPLLWSLRPIRKPALPPVRNRDWPLSPIDAFVLSKLEEKQLAPNGPADRRTLIRRATFDLIGLPPTPEEIEAFVADPSPDAFDRVVERLLASAHYGERWGRHWLDAARYADTAGDACDFPIPQAWRYRNYVIQAFNRDLPYDQFLREQIAGDLMPSRSEPEKYGRIIATGFIALSRRPGLYPEREVHLTIEDTLETLGRSVLGLSLGCARCHDHKFDPLTTDDYYALYGIFQSTRYPFAGSEDAEGSGYQRDLTPLVPGPEAQAALAPWERRLGAAEAELDRLRALRAPRGEAQRARTRVVAERPVLEAAFAVREGTPADARIQRRGDPMTPGPEVPRRFLSALGGRRLPDPGSESGRRELAEWLVEPGNPLTPRAMVNRIWQHHFGRGLVRTADDLGSRGTPPTHPELLDYLATRFREGGWSIKAMHRLILLSRTWQQSSAGNARNQEIDPDAEFLWRVRPRSLDAESLRDAILAVSGDLDRTMAGPHPIPPEKEWAKMSSSSPFELRYETRRRSVYLFQGRLKKNAYLTLFDGPNPNAPTALRSATATPLQALFLMNDRFVIEQSEKLARRLLMDRSSDPERIGLAFELAFGRRPRKEEQTACEAQLLLLREKLRTTGLPPEDHLVKAWASLLQSLLSSNEFVFLD
jgi:hypothetical protein